MSEATYEIRQVRDEEWRRLRELRLAALADPVAAVAFTETYERAVTLPDSAWRQRVGRLRNGRLPAITLVGEAGDGSWGGMLTVFEDGEQANVIAVYMRPEHRGTGLAEQLFEAAREWAWSRKGVRRLRLHVHEGNPRAEAFYRRFGFARTGETMVDAKDPEGRALEFEMALERDVAE